MSIKKEQLYFEEKILPAGESVITCSYDYYGTRMTASLRPTNAENYAYLGRIVIKDDKGKNLKNDKGKDVEKKFFIKKNENSREMIESCIEKNMDAIYVMSAKFVAGHNNSSVDPVSITPIAAVVRFGHGFIKSKCTFRGKNIDKLTERRYKLLEEMASSLPKISMKDFNERILSKELNKYARNEIKHFYDFWEYCLDEGIAAGENHIVVPPIKKHNKNQIARKKMQKYASLTMNDQDNLYDEIEKDLRGYKIGMLLELGVCMYSADDIFSYSWADISFCSPFQEMEDFAVLRRRYRRQNCPINNGSVVIAPRAAELLKKRYTELVNIYKNVEKVNRMPIVSKMDNPSVALNIEAYRKDTHSFLRSLLRKSKDFKKAQMRLEDGESMIVPPTFGILKTTYKNNINNRVRFSDNPEMRDFLFGEIKYDDTTSLNYICFTTLEAQLRYYKAFQVLKKKEKMDRNCVIAGLEESAELIAMPETNMDYTQSYLEIILNPGEKFKPFSDGEIKGDYEMIFL